MARTSITIVLELDEAVDIPVGSARLPDGTYRTFHGWLGSLRRSTRSRV